MTDDDFFGHTAPPEGPRVLATALSLVLISPFLVAFALAIGDHAVKTPFGAAMIAGGTILLLLLPAHFAFGHRAKWIIKVLAGALVVLWCIAMALR